MTARFRTEQDGLGAVQLPADALYGIHTLRALENFPFSGPALGDEPELTKGFALIKKACALANAELGTLDAPLAAAIVSACQDMADGRLGSALRVGLYEGSGGTSLNMNTNEVLANQALVAIGRRPGDYGAIHPNDHVNRSQSTNDVTPSAVAIACFMLASEASEALVLLGEAFAEQAERQSGVVKLGRTCLQDAQPMMLGQSFSGYAELASRSAASLKAAARGLLCLPLGGTAIGTGFGAPVGWRETVFPILKQKSGLPVSPSPNLFDAMANADGFARLAGEAAAVAGGLGKISGDLILLSSGPCGGLGEIRLPEVQAGSSIMPGKVNPVIPMAVRQAGHVVQGHAVAVQAACADGLLEINHYEPAIAAGLTGALRLVRDGARVLASHCVSRIEANPERASEHLFRSSALSTHFAAKLGYARTAELVRRASDLGCSFVEQAEQEGLLSPGQADELARASAHSGQ